MYKSGYAVIIGRPNVGKSTLMNHLIGQKIAITSNRPQTTRNRIETVLTTEEGQIIFLDTPGMIRKADNKLGEYLIDVSDKTIGDADVILWLVEPSSYIGHGDRDIAEKLKKQKKPVILIINKIDTIDKKKAPEILEAWEKVLAFDDIIVVSALRGLNVEEVIRAILKRLPEGPQYYDEEVVTDQNMRQLAAEIIREKALRALNEEVPHGIAVQIDSYKERSEDLTAIEASIICERDSHKGIIIGKGGSMLKKIGTAARRDIEEMTGTKVFLKLFVKVRRNWRDNEKDVRSFGYDRKSL
ncbi:MAG TPA: GTPase Era [Lachnospiraceae bacterium]|nr:GTPase Era [Lachnospiraceae bacterium]